ncbi:GGDEF domain-containing protein [Selenomonas sp. F0473]|uniref:GGDEF domain-containing protein n=1 Tax=Selenomonas sp. F0473 TaxID=999423 RepID=UPI0025F988FB|nr:GGDEF domain-containing protein [Selenomonas sp. F0473]
MRAYLCSLFGLLLVTVLLCAGHPVSASGTPLEWEYWTERTPIPQTPAKRPPNFSPNDGQWRQFNPQYGVPVPDGARYVWVRVLIPLDTAVDESLFFSTTDQSVQVFLDGIAIYRYGDLDYRPYSYGRKWHLVNLPTWAAGQHLIMQVYSDNPRVLGQFDRIRMDRTSRLIEHLFICDFPYVSGVTALLIFMMLIGVYFFTEKKLRDIYVRLIAFLAVFFFWMISSSSLMLLWLDFPIFWWYVETASAYLIILAGQILIYRIIDAEYKPRILRVSCVYVVILLLAGGLELAGLHGMYAMRFFFFPALAACGIPTGYWLWHAHKNGNAHCQSILIAFAVLSVLAVIDGLSFQFRLFSWNTYLLPFGIYTIAFFIVRLILDRAENERYLSNLSASLESQVDAVTKRMEVDPLTGCYNRNKFGSAVKEFMRIARDTREPFSLIMFDIDHFKRINDTYGHDAGDAVLMNFARTIRTFLDRRHVFIRWGGEEFILLCLHYDGAQATAFANIIREAVSEEPLHPQDRITCSGGVGVWYGSDEDTAERMVKRADTALYAAKQNGRNRVACEPDWETYAPKRTPKPPKRE